MQVILIHAIKKKLQKKKVQNFSVLDNFLYIKRKQQTGA